MVAHLVPALLPGPCAVLNRSKWLGCEKTFAWCGLLASHHNLLTKLMVEWQGSASKEHITAAPAPVVEGPSTGPGLGPLWSAWAAVPPTMPKPSDIPSSSSCRFVPGILSMLPLSSSPKDATDPASDDEFVAAIPETLSGDIDWAEHNKATVKKAVMWTETGPGDPLIIISLAFKPILRLMRSMIWLGSEGFQKQESQKVVMGEQRSWRVLEMFLQNDMSKFRRAMDQLFHQPSDAIRDSGRVCHLRTLFFRLLSRSYCSVEQVFAYKFRLSPFCLFGSLWGLTSALEELPLCMRDELTQAFVDQYGIEGLTQPEAQAKLCVAAELLQMDIVGIEVRHASARRIGFNRSCHTWTMAHEDLSADFLCRQQVICKEHVHGRALAPKKEKRQKKKQRWCMEGILPSQTSWTSVHPRQGSSGSC